MATIGKTSCHPVNNLKCVCILQFRPAEQLVVLSSLEEVSYLSVCRLNRASQTYFFPIHLTDQLLPSAVFYATVGPLVFYLAIQRLIIRPYVRAQKEQ